MISTMVDAKARLVLRDYGQFPLEFQSPQIKA